MNGAELFVGELQKRGVPFIATLCGHGLNHLDKACRDRGLRLIDVRNEQAASYIAEATGRLTRSVGVCAVSSGVAHANGLTGVLNAHFDGAPMLLVTGCGPTPTIGRGHFQDFDQIALAASICKYARLMDRPERIPLYVHEAFSAALSGRPGPVHLTFPIDIQTAEINPDHLPVLPEPVGPPIVQAAADPQHIASIVDLLAEAERPLLIAGGGLYYAGGEAALAAFVRTFPIPVVVPIWDRGAIPRPTQTFQGVIGAATGGPRLLVVADLILMVGARCDYRVGDLEPPGISPDAKIVRVDADPAELRQGVGAHLAVHGNPGVVIAQLAEEIADRSLNAPTDWLEEATARRDAFEQACGSRPETGGRMHALDLIQAIKTVLSEDTILVIDGGNIGQWAHQLLLDRYPGHWLTCGASGVVGYGIPGAMAARALYPDRPVLLLSGDGSLTFTVAEFETAARQNLPFVALLADDEAWGITLTGHEQQWGGGITSELGPIRFDQMAEAFGARGIRIEAPGDIAPAIRQAFTAPVPTLIHCPIVRGNPADR